MRRIDHLPLLAVAVVCGAGCRTSTSNVYVNIASCVRTSPPETSVPLARVPAPAAQSTTFEIAGAPQVTEGRTSALGAAKVKASIEANRAKTLKLVTQRLRDAYQREAQNLRTQELATLTPVRAKIMADALKKVDVAYVKYADAVGPKIANLAVNAGFPDPDKNGKRKPSGFEGLDTLAYETSQRLRGEIAALKAEFKRYSDATLRAADADADAKVTELLAAVDRQVGDIDARAQQVARREVSQAQADLGPLLADESPKPLPAVPARSVTVASGVLPPSPNQPLTGVEPSNADSLARAKQDLGIWLSVNGYVLTAKGHGRNATEEFIQWRNKFKPAPSTQP